MTMEQYKEIQIHFGRFSVVSSYKVESSCAPKSEKVDLFVYVLICIFIILNTFINLIFSFEPSLLLLYFDNK